MEEYQQGLTLLLIVDKVIILYGLQVPVMNRVGYLFSVNSAAAS